MMTNLDDAVQDIARDAIRECRPFEAAACVGDQPKTQLIGDLVAALWSLASAAKITYIALHTHVALSAAVRGKPACWIQCLDLDALRADIAACGGECITDIKLVDGETQRWREFAAEIRGVKVHVIGDHRPLKGTTP